MLNKVIIYLKSHGLNSKNFDLSQLFWSIVKISTKLNFELKYKYKYRMGAASSQKNSELYSVLKPINWQK